ncbi:MAG TPA: head GIN domain-containing protein [Cyclobacteriaceae bacterium]|nr:head GIN domain-containing protein [Cyclobacteriaceae bacterium]
MKKASVILLLIAGILSFTSAQAQKGVKIKTDKFTGVSLRTSGNVYIKHGKESSVEIETSNELMEMLDVYVQKDVLMIEFKRNSRTWNWRNPDKLDVYITMPEITMLNISSSGNIRTENKFKSDELNLKISGSGTIEAAADANVINADISGSGNIRMKGSAKVLYPSISGSGKIDAEELITETVSIKISGSGNCTVNVKDDLNARVSGSGNIYYKGEPKHVNTSISGSGKVKKLS